MGCCTTQPEFSVSHVKELKTLVEIVEKENEDLSHESGLVTNDEQVIIHKNEMMQYTDEIVFQLKRLQIDIENTKQFEILKEYVNKFYQSKPKDSKAIIDMIEVKNELIDFIKVLVRKVNEK